MAITLQDIYVAIALNGISFNGSTIRFASAQDVAAYIAQNGNFPSYATLTWQGQQVQYGVSLSQLVTALPPVDSSGQIAASQQAARDDGANTQNPQAPATTLTLDGRIVPTNQNSGVVNTTVVNGQTVAQDEEAGTDGPLVSISQSQATPPPGTTQVNGQSVNTLQGVDPTTGLTPEVAAQIGSAYGYNTMVGSTPGAGAGTGFNNQSNTNDDNTGTNNQTTSQVLSQTFTGQIPTQANQLDQYASYTYSLSWYLLTPSQYNAMLDSQKKDISNWQLLMQSGGAAPTPTIFYEADGQGSQSTGGRSQYFPVDYYMDDLEIDSKIPLGGTNMSNSATDLRFKVTEPNGITLINNLYQAVTSVYKQTQQAVSSTTNTIVNTTSQNPNYPMAQYCMVIHFYGYDSNGNLVAPATGTYIDSSNNISSTAVIEKYYPFVISNIKFHIANKQIEYEVLGKPIPHFYNLSTDRGTIPFNFNLTGQTIGQVLIGKPVATQSYTDPTARTTTPVPTNVSVTSPATASVLDNTVSTINNGVDTVTGINFNF